jgi:hypothetical protein
MDRDGAERALAVLRALLLAVLALALVGTGAELFLIGHTEEIWQLLPLIAIGLGLLGCGALALRPTRATVQLFRLLMGCFIVTGALGLVLHFRGNTEFELEMRPSMSGFELVWNSLTGATPALAPGSMIQLGLLGLLCTLGHAALDPDGRPASKSAGEAA